ncbi:hypothetical protein RBH20_09715 [Haloarcula sp. H-GB4]|uniref:hypothetical protein n=1 Tax=Haloarcula sp. H-GB4 TaxID=3069755 RepID=UPI0027B5552B|nr:hypothetical protein [Haloarcula sp. H-GB4]MDQ2072810.1 hypothetical protein [Haloarcula sp. H-GB4]
MTDNASAHAREADDAGDYDDLLATLDMLESETLRKVENGRVYDAKNERVRIKWIRIAKDVIAEKRKVMADRDLQELSERIEQLEERSDDPTGSNRGLP